MLSTKYMETYRKLFVEADKKTAAVFKVLSDMNRFRIFRILAEQPRFTVSGIAQILNISLPLASQHIKILAQANLLQKEKNGKKVFTKLEETNPFVQAIMKTIQHTHQ